MNPYGDQVSDESRLSVDRDLPTLTSRERSQPEAGDCAIWVKRQPSEIASEDSNVATLQTNLLSPPTGPVMEESLTENEDLSFLLCEDSIVLSESHFESLPSFPPEPTVVSSSFSRSRQLLCSDSLDGHGPTHASTAPTFYDCQDNVDDGSDFFLATAEEASLDSGLGSVESVYTNSEEESVLSPDPTQSSSSSQVTQTVTTVETLDVETKKPEVYYECLPKLESSCLSKKRKHGHEISKEDQPELKKHKTKKRVNFQDVTVFYFPRKQGFVSVPSQGGSTLGMAMHHVEASTMTIRQHKLDITQRHNEKVREHQRERKIENKIKQLQFMNPELDNSTLSTMAQSAVGQVDTGPSASHEGEEALDNLDEFFFLQPISAKQRRKLLRLAGVERIDGEEKLMNRVLRESREMCGCSCEEVCVPDTCECALEGIQCQVDRESFPCGCVASGCQNENGRIEFDVDRVQIHLLDTLQRLQQNEESIDAQLESAASSESDCDFASSDDSPPQFEVVDADPGCGDKGNCTEDTGNGQNCNSVNFVGDCSTRTCSQNCENSDVPQNFLDTLGLKRVEIRCKSNEREISQIAKIAAVFAGSSSTVNAEASNSQDLIPGGFSYGECLYPRYCHHKSIESLAQSIPDSPPQFLPRQMYGATSSTSYCQSASSVADRGLSVSLEPIASFMTESCSVSLKESVTCSSSC